MVKIKKFKKNTQKKKKKKKRIKENRRTEKKINIHMFAAID